MLPAREQQLIPVTPAVASRTGVSTSRKPSPSSSRLMTDVMRARLRNTSRTPVVAIMSRYLQEGTLWGIAGEGRQGSRGPVRRTWPQPGSHAQHAKVWAQAGLWHLAKLLCHAAVVACPRSGQGPPVPEGQHSRGMAAAFASSFCVPHAHATCMYSCCCQTPCLCLDHCSAHSTCWAGTAGTGSRSCCRRTPHLCL